MVFFSTLTRMSCSYLLKLVLLAQAMDIKIVVFLLVYVVCNRGVVVCNRGVVAL